MGIALRDQDGHLRRSEDLLGARCVYPHRGPGRARPARLQAVRLGGSGPGQPIERWQRCARGHARAGP
jgi:hypothetical protein